MQCVINKMTKKPK